MGQGQTGPRRRESRLTTAESVWSALVSDKQRNDGITLFAVTPAVRHACGRIPSSLTSALHLSPAK